MLEHFVNLFEIWLFSSMGSRCRARQQLCFGYRSTDVKQRLPLPHERCKPFRLPHAIVHRRRTLITHCREVIRGHVECIADVLQKRGKQFHSLPTLPAVHFGRGNIPPSTLERVTQAGDVDIGTHAGTFECRRFHH